MSALLPARAPASGVRWTDPPTHLDSTHPSCCLFYKQSTCLSPLCFHGFTNPFSPNSFPFTSICVAPWCFPRALRISGIPAPHSVGELMFSIAYSLFFALGSFFGACAFCFQRLTASFAENRGVGGGVVNPPKLALPSMRGLGVDPMLDVRLQETQRDRTLLQDRFVEGADVELAGQLALGFGAQFADLELAKLVGQGLARPHDVAIDLDRDVLIGRATVWLAALKDGSYRYSLRAPCYPGWSEEAGDVFAHHVLPVGPVVAAVGAPIVEGVANVFAGEDFGDSIGGAGIFPLAGAGGDVDVAGG